MKPFLNQVDTLSKLKESRDQKNRSNFFSQNFIFAFSENILFLTRAASGRFYTAQFTVMDK